MPIFDYVCKTCGERKNEIMSIKEYEAAPLPTCPTCGEVMEREIGTTHGRVIGFNAQNGYSHG